MKCSLIIFTLSTAIQASEDLPSDDLSPQNMSMAESDQRFCNNPCPENNCCFNCCQEMCDCIDTYACTRCCAICCVRSYDLATDFNRRHQTTYGERCINCLFCTLVTLICCPCMICACCSEGYYKYEKEEEKRNIGPKHSANKKRAVSPESE